MKHDRSSIFVPTRLKAIIKSRSAAEGVFQYQYLSKLVLQEIERTQHTRGDCPLKEMQVASWQTEEERAPPL